MKNIISLTICILFITTCTDNPFFDDKISIDEHNTVKGKITLSDQADPSNIYVWLEGFNLYDWTDSAGNFKIELPPAKSQPGSGLNGIYGLYFYTANYRYIKYPMHLINGEFDYDSGFLDSGGNFQQDILLEKLLNVSVSVTPAKINPSSREAINISIDLECLADSLIVEGYLTSSDVPGGFLFEEINSLPEEAMFLQNDSVSFRKAIIKDTVSGTIPVILPPKIFPDGAYEVWPYIRIIQDGLPDELLTTIDENIFELDYHYLSWPVKLQPGNIIIDQSIN
ncbi:MAG: hypothetical protein P8X42_11965 [Calditrichaceae bacterium]|jgi:hypothetical protein